ncbi:MAG: hotdog fold thioesterase [Bacteroidota bacterium]
MIWFKKYDLQELNDLRYNTAVEHLGINITEIGDNFLIGTMPVDNRTKQPVGILHGGASVLLAESLGSIASYMVLDSGKFRAVGLEINANHLRMVKDSYVTGKAIAVHIGKKTHVWSIEISDKDGKLACISRLTMAVIEV